MANAAAKLSLSSLLQLGKCDHIRIRAAHICIVDSVGNAGNDVRMNTNSSSATSRREFHQADRRGRDGIRPGRESYCHTFTQRKTTPSRSRWLVVAVVARARSRGCAEREARAMKLVAMADVFESQLSRSFNSLKQAFPTAVECRAKKQFVGFDGYKHAMDALRPGDIVILATPPGVSVGAFCYAVAKGLNVFMEKPVTVDGPTSKRMFALAEAAPAKRISKVGVGLMSRHSRALQELHQRIQDGEIGI